jgi:hypothetical protein
MREINFKKIDEIIDTFYFNLSLKQNDIVKVIENIPEIYSESTFLYKKILSKITSLSKEKDLLKLAIFNKQKNNPIRVYTKTEIEEYFVSGDKKIIKLSKKIEKYEGYIMRLDQLFNLLNNMSFITKSFIKIQEKRGKI